MQLLTADAAARIESHIGTVIDRHLAAPELDALRVMVKAYVLAGGKRIRPQLVAWTYALASDDGALCPTLLDIAAGWELFHAFLLVHDDIIDESASRREQPALHYQLASLDGQSLKFGTNLAIVAGDLLFSAAMCLWHGVEISDVARHRDLLKVFSRVACTTGFGQAIDICASHRPLGSIDAATLLREYHWKTAAYTFEGPMLSGAILAGVPESGRQAISKYALSLGQAYQLQNDINDLDVPAHAGCDLVQGKRTLIMVRHREQLGTREKREFDARLAEIGSGGVDAVVRAEKLREELLDDETAICYSRAMIDRLLNDASAAANDAALPAPLTKGMGKLLDELGRRYFVSQFAEILCL